MPLRTPVKSAAVVNAAVAPGIARGAFLCRPSREGCRLVQEREGLGTGSQWDLHGVVDWPVATCLLLLVQTALERQKRRSEAHSTQTAGQGDVWKATKKPREARREDPGQRGGLGHVDQMSIERVSLNHNTFPS